MAVQLPTTQSDDLCSIKTTSLHQRSWTQRLPAPGDADTQYLLETLSADLMDAHLSTQPLEYAVVHNHCSPDFRMMSENMHEFSFPQSKNLQEHLDNIKAMRKVNPLWNKDCSNYTAQIQQDANHAVVWFTTMGTSEPAGCSTQRESISRLYWRRREGDGVWEAYQQKCIRGPGNLFARMW